MDIPNELRKRYSRPDHYSDSEWDQQLELLAGGRQLTAAAPNAVALAQTPAIGATVYAAKSMETLMSEHADLGVVTPDAKFGMTKDAAIAASSRIKALAETCAQVAKHIDARAGKGASTTLGEDLDAALSSVGVAALDAACGHFGAVDLSKAMDGEERKEKALSEENVTAAVQHIGAAVESLLDVRRKVQEGDEDTAAMEAQLKAVTDAIAGIAALIKGESAEEPTEAEVEAAKVAAAKAEPPAEPTEEVDTEKAAEILTKLVQEKLVILVEVATALQAGVGTMDAKDAQAQFSKLADAVWGVRDDFLMLAKSMGHKVADRVDVARVTALEKAMAEMKVSVAKSLKEQFAEITQTQEAATQLLEAFEAAVGIASIPAS